MTGPKRRTPGGQGLNSWEQAVRRQGAGGRVVGQGACVQGVDQEVSGQEKSGQDVLKRCVVRNLVIS